MSNVGVKRTLVWCLYVWRHFKMARMVFFMQAVEAHHAVWREWIFWDRENPLDTLNNEELYSRYRFRRQELFELAQELSPDIKSPTGRNAAISPTNQVLLALRFYATGAFQNLIGDSLGVHKSTVSRIIHSVCSLDPQTSHEVNFPVAQQQVKLTMDKFYEMAEFPGMVGCVDGTHIRIQSPSEQEYEYVNRKGYHSLNVQLICDADCRIINCVIKWPGSTHDSRISKESAIFRVWRRTTQRHNLRW